MKPIFDMRILIMGLVVLCALAARPIERLRLEGLRLDPAVTGSIPVEARSSHRP